MLSDTLQLRRAAIAYLFQNSIQVERRDNMEFYDAVTQEGIDLPQMQQLPNELVLLNPRGVNQGFEVRVGRMPLAAPAGVNVQAPYRLLIAETGSPRPHKFFVDAADTVFEAFRKIWKDRRGTLQLVEVSLAGAFSAESEPGGAAGFLRDRALMGEEPIKRSLGRDFGQFGVKMSSPMHLGDLPGLTVPLKGAQLELSIESVVQDPKLLAVQLLAKWQRVQLPMKNIQLPPQLKEALGGMDMIDINTEANDPREYLEPVYEYFTDNVGRFVAHPDR